MKGRMLAAVLVIFGLSCGGASIGLSMAFGLAGQLIALPFFFIGAFAFGTWLGSR